MNLSAREKNNSHFVKTARLKSYFFSSPLFLCQNPKIMATLFDDIEPKAETMEQ